MTNEQKFVTFIIGTAFILIAIIDIQQNKKINQLELDLLKAYEMNLENTKLLNVAVNHMSKQQKIIDTLKSHQ